jgi:hypothetical protein
VQDAGHILRPIPGKTTAEVHDHHDVATGVLASSLANALPATSASAFRTPGASLVGERDGVMGSEAVCVCSLSPLGHEIISLGVHIATRLEPPVDNAGQRQNLLPSCAHALDSRLRDADPVHD